MEPIKGPLPRVLGASGPVPHVRFFPRILPKNWVSLVGEHCALWGWGKGSSCLRRRIQRFLLDVSCLPLEAS